MMIVIDMMMVEEAHVTGFRTACYVAASALGLSLSVSMANAKSPQGQVLSAVERGKTPSAETLIDCIQGSYRGLTRGAFRNDMSYVAITRAPDRADLTVEGHATILHRGTDYRFESSPMVVVSQPAFGDTSSFEGDIETRLVFVRRDDQLRALKEQLLPSGPVTQAFEIDLSGFDPEVARRVTGPFATLFQFDLLEATSDLSVQREIYQGVELLTLSTEDEAATSFDENVEFSTFFVDPSTCLILRMEQHLEDVEQRQFIEFEGDFSYTIGVRVPSRAFELRFPAGVVVEDLTNDAEVMAGIEEQVEFDDDVIKGPE